MNTAPVEELLRETIGLDVSTVGRGVVERALRRRLSARPDEDPATWARRLRADPELLRRVIEDVVVPETWFFRDGRPFEVLAAEAVKRRMSGRLLRVLSLPCATGEEAWTIAITLREAGFAAGEFRVRGCDLSGVAITAARRGFYGRNSFRGEIGDWRTRWFSPAPGGWVVGEELRESVEFAEMNLFAEPEPGGPYDFVFCRNLLIYFDLATQAEALRRLRALLAPGGLLFVGHAEAPAALRAGFHPWPEPRSFAFAATAGAKDAKRGDGSVEATKKALRPPAPPPPRPPGPRALPFADVRVSPPAAPAAAKADVSLVEAARLADRGELGPAAELAERHLERHGPDAEAYYLLGLVRDATGDETGAETAYRKAIYLAPGHARALAHLAPLLEMRGAHAEAKRLRARAARGGEA